MQLGFKTRDTVSVVLSYVYVYACLCSVVAGENVRETRAGRIVGCVAVADPR